MPQRKVISKHSKYSILLGKLRHFFLGTAIPALAGWFLWDIFPLFSFPWLIMATGLAAMALTLHNKLYTIGLVLAGAVTCLNIYYFVTAQYVVVAAPDSIPRWRKSQNVTYVVISPSIAEYLKTYSFEPKHRILSAEKCNDGTSVLLLPLINNSPLEDAKENVLTKPEILVRRPMYFWIRSIGIDIGISIEGNVISNSFLSSAGEIFRSTESISALSDACKSFSNNILLHPVLEYLPFEPSSLSSAIVEAHAITQLTHKLESDRLSLLDIYHLMKQLEETRSPNSGLIRAYILQLAASTVGGNQLFLLKINLLARACQAAMDSPAAFTFAFQGFSEKLLQYVAYSLTDASLLEHVPSCYGLNKRIAKNNQQYSLDLSAVVEQMMKEYDDRVLEAHGNSIDINNLLDGACPSLRDVHEQRWAVSIFSARVSELRRRADCTSIFWRAEEKVKFDALQKIKSCYPHAYAHLEKYDRSPWPRSICDDGNKSDPVVSAEIADLLRSYLGILPLDDDMRSLVDEMHAALEIIVLACEGRNQNVCRDAAFNPIGVSNPSNIRLRRLVGKIYPGLPELIARGGGGTSEEIVSVLLSSSNPIALILNCQMLASPTVARITKIDQERYCDSRKLRLLRLRSKAP